MIRQLLSTVQTFLGQQQLDGWLVYDFRGTNPFARKVLNHGGSLLTRRWFVWIPQKGSPQVLVHDIEFGSFPAVGFPLHKYNGYQSLRQALQQMLGGAKRIAMEYSPDGNIPYVSKVDGGTIDMMRALGCEVHSSADLLQLFVAFNQEQINNHIRAAQMLTQTKDAALAWLRSHVQQGQHPTEYQLQQYMNQFMESKGFITAHAPIVGFGPGGGDPHYVPSASHSKTLAPGDAILMDLFCKVPGDNPFADITWMAFYGTPTERFMQVFNTVIKSRDAGLALLQERVGSGQAIRGFEVDQAVRAVLISAGYEAQLKHRTGHSLGSDAAHGDAAHFDGYETLDERLVLPGHGFTIEPGVYFDDFGVRSEINLFVQEGAVLLTTAKQEQIDLV